MMLPGFVAEYTISRNPSIYFTVESVVNNENGNIYPQQSDPFQCMEDCCCRFFPRSAACVTFGPPDFNQSFYQNYCITGDNSQGKQCLQKCTGSSV
jgi:hypothetical protein